MDSSPKRYLMVIKTVVFLYSHFWPMAEAVQKAGWDVWIAADCDADPKRILDAGMKFLPLPSVDGLGQIVGELESIIKLNALLHKVKPDLVHFIYLKNVLTGGIIARLNGVPAVLGAITGMGSLFANDRPLYRVIQRGVVAGLRIGYRQSNSVLAFENSDDRDYFVSRGAIRKERSAIIPGAGVDKDWTTYRPWQGRTPIILCAARMIQDKGIIELIEACRMLRRRGVPFELWLAGGIYFGNPTSLTEQQLKIMEEERIGKWLGQRTDMSSLLEAASIFCLPTYYREGLPRVLVEAGAAGRPSVTTDVPGCRDIVKDGINGLLIPPKDPTALADALQYLLQNPEKREEMGVAARRVFESSFTLDAVLISLSECFSRLGVPLNLSTDRHLSIVSV